MRVGEDSADMRWGNREMEMAPREMEIASYDKGWIFRKVMRGATGEVLTQQNARGYATSGQGALAGIGEKVLVLLR